MLNLSSFRFSSLFICTLLFSYCFADTNNITDTEIASLETEIASFKKSSYEEALSQFKDNYKTCCMTYISHVSGNYKFFRNEGLHIPYKRACTVEEAKKDTKDCLKIILKKIELALTAYPEHEGIQSFKKIVENKINDFKI